MKDQGQANRQCGSESRITPSAQLNTATQLHLLGMQLTDRFRSTEAIEDIKQAIEYFSRALELTAAGHPDRAKHLQSLSGAYRDRYRRTGSTADLNKSIELSREVLAASSEDDSSRGDHFHDLGIGYANRHQRTGSVADLELAIQQFYKALEITPSDHQNRGLRLQNLGTAFREKFCCSSDIEDAAKAIRILQEAIQITSSDHPQRAKRLQSLAVVLQDRYEEVGSTADAEQSIQLLEEALALTPVGHSDRVIILYTIGLGYVNRFERLGAAVDLDKSIQFLQEALDLTPTDHPTRADILEGLDYMYTAKYELQGQLKDLEQSFQLGHDAIDLTPDDHPNKAAKLQMLGINYLARYQKFLAMNDLEYSIQLFQDARRLTAVGQLYQADMSQNLGVCYRGKYQRSNMITDLDQAIEFFQESLELTPATSPDRANRLSNIGAAYGDRYAHSESIVDLNQSIQFSQEAIDATTPSYLDNANRLQNLGISYQQRYLKLRSMVDLEKYIQLFQATVDLTPADHPDRAHHLQRLALGHGERYSRTGASLDLNKSIKFGQEALDHSISPAGNRLGPGQSLLKAYSLQNRWLEAYQVAYKTIHLVPLLTPRFLETSDKQALLTSVVNLASDAAAVALNAAKTPFEAIELLELGRGVIAGSLIELRNDISELQSLHPRLAERFIRLRNQIDSLSTSHPKNLRYTASQELEQLAREIRDLPGFDRFLLTPSEEELKSAARDGPVVIINVSSYRCDALIIHNTRTQLLPLPGLQADDIRDRSRSLLGSPETLQWLWSNVTQPILEELGFTGPPADAWPHIWWVPTGLLAKFPIHAAGVHSPTSSNAAVLDRVISSYTVSVRAILHSRSNPCRADFRLSLEKVVLISMLKTPQHADLPFAPEEVRKLEALCQPVFHVEKPQLLREDVVLALDECKIFHFAGHGRTDLSDPSKSCLLLEDWEENPLTVAYLLETNLYKQQPFLAYLAACGTGRMGNDRLIDEGIHLISACQIAGFRHVIGTLWEVNDKLCVEIAVRIYEWMINREMTSASVSEGLHEASRFLRRCWIEDNATRGAFDYETDVKALVRAADQLILGQKGNDSRDVEPCDDVTLSPALWVPYVHFGG